MEYNALPNAVLKMWKMLKFNNISNPNRITKYYIVHYRQISQNVENEHFAIFFLPFAYRLLSPNIGKNRSNAFPFAALALPFCFSVFLPLKKYQSVI